MSTNPPPIALTSLSIRDFRGIADLDLDFCGPDGLPNQLIVLAGPNGIGKTAVLEAGLLACGGYALMTGSRGREAVRKGRKTYQIEAQIVHQETSLRVIDDPSREPPSPRPPVPHWYFSSWRAPKFVGPVDVTLGRPGRKSAKTDGNRLKTIKTILVNAAAAESFRPRQSNSFQRPLNLELNQYSTWIEAINVGWREFYPDSDQLFFVDLVDAAWEGPGSFDVFLATKGSDRISVDRLSSGQLEVFLFLSALALNDDREGIVFIDEPELHLDPQWHRPIVRSLMKLQPRAQFIVATHSPEIYDAAQSFERHFLVPEGDALARPWGAISGIEAGA